MRRQEISADTDLQLNLDFIKEFIFHPTKTGAVAPSSELLADFMTDVAELSETNTVIEFGSGTGVITEKIIDKLNDNTTFFALEINPTFVEATKTRCPDALVYQSSATNVKQLMDLHDTHGCDRIISSLPWAIFNSELQDSLLDTIYEVLHPGGKFLTYSYWHALPFPTSRRFRSKLYKKFNNVTRTKTVWNNFPPAVIYCAEKV